MKKLISIVLAALIATSVFGVSYKNNTYQKLADEYTKKAEKAMDAGEYDDAIAYSAEAQKNAELSKAFIARMMAMGEAEDNIFNCHESSRILPASWMSPNSRAWAIW